MKMLETRRCILLISYSGTAFRGSQIQKTREGQQNVETVQWAVEKALQSIFGLPGERPIKVILSSRTDKGVHALKTAISVDLPPYRQKFLKPLKIKLSLNSFFSNSRNIRVLDVFEVPDSFKLSSVISGKTYLYRVGLLKKEFCNDAMKTALPVTECNNSCIIKEADNFDFMKAKEASHLFEGKNDFGAIVGNPSRNTVPTICNIETFTLEEAKPLVPFDPLSQKYNFYHFICKGDRFLLHLVRRMVCLSLSVGLNYTPLDDIKKALSNPVPSSWPRKTMKMVSGTGLYLVDINFDMEKIHSLQYDSEDNKEKFENKGLPVVEKF